MPYKDRRTVLPVMELEERHHRMRTTAAKLLFDAANADGALHQRLINASVKACRRAEWMRRLLFQRRRPAPPLP